MQTLYRHRGVAGYQLGEAGLARVQALRDICLYETTEHSPFAEASLESRVLYFQAEDGIRDLTVTGVQTCALPIYLHHAVQGITSELGVAEMLERLLLAVAQAIGTTSLRVELTDPPGVQVVARGDTGDQPRSVLAGARVEPADEWPEGGWAAPPPGRGRRVCRVAGRPRMP